MRESARIALSYVRSKAADLGIDADSFAQTDVHVHVPAGAIPKDGPSAGIAMTMAIASLFTGRPVKGSLGMTGEVTLRGRVMPIGGVKMKVLAAHRAGLTTVILPKRNERDLEELPADVRSRMTFVLVERIDEALEAGLSLKGADGHAPAHELIA
jgi:ATP-dependent Lon protease